MSCAAVVMAQRTITMSEGLLTENERATLGLAEADSAITATVFASADTTDHYCNGAVVTMFGGRLYCMWQSSARDEDEATTCIRFSTSDDEGLTWSPSEVLQTALDGAHCTSGGWMATRDTLVAYVNVWPDTLSVVGGYAYCKISTDGVEWSDLEPVRMADGSRVDGVIEQDPHQTLHGRVVGAVHFMPGLHVSPVYTDDQRGVTGWRRGSFECTDKGKQSRELEPSLYVTADSLVVMVFRDQSSSFRKLAAVSRDNGETWTNSFETGIPDCRSKQCAGNLPDGRSFLVGCPVMSKNRYPLVVMLSRDGWTFDKAYLLRSGDDLSARQYEGRFKTEGYNYPKALVTLRYLYVSYATNKEAIQVTRIPIGSL